MKFDMEPVNNEKSATSKNIIKVIGVGGAGGNAVNNMAKEGIVGVDYYLINTDAQDFKKSPIPDENKIQIGKSLTEGLGAGNNPERGEAAAKESIDDIKAMFDKSTKMVFITAGMGGGTGTGAAPIVAKVAKEKDILTVAVVTTPSLLEGAKRLKNAKKGLEELKKYVDSVIVISNDKINELYADKPITEAWRYADETLTIAVKGIAEIITVKGYVNVDFADVHSVLKDSGVALMSIGEAKGEKREALALREALSSPLLNNNNIEGAKNVLIHFATSEEDEATAREITNVMGVVQKLTGKTDIIYGVSKIDENNKEFVGKLRITMIITGFNANEDIIDENADINVSDEILNIVKEGLNISSSKKEDDKYEDTPIIGKKVRKTISEIKENINEEEKKLPYNPENKEPDKAGTKQVDKNGNIHNNPYFDKNVD